MSELLDGLVHPIVAAPMAGGPSTPRLAAAVSQAGGLGFLGAGYLTADRLAEDVAETRKLTDAPFGVNVFLPGPAGADPEAVAGYARHLAGEAARRGAKVGEPLGGDDDYPAKIELLHRDPVAVVSFAFGLPDPAVVRGLQSRGSEVWVTLTRPDEALAATALGVDAVIAQGIEAGGHRGGTHDTDEYALLPLLRLLAARTGLPLVAAGGVADGSALAAVLAAGASAAQIGTAFLGCPEAGTSPVYRAVLTGRARLSAASSETVVGQGDPADDGPTRTVLTRAFTGRRARGLANAFIAEHEEHAVSAYPQLHRLTSPLRAAARAAGDPDGFNLWAGQSYPLIRELPAAALVQKLSAEARAAVANAARRLGPRG
ncbi:MAG TPA: nitronate monooxygenase [Actinocrinis sp.]|nr:nitronate monooxygenase [Actinocrinis sp.]